MFQTDKLYTKNDIYQILNVPDSKRKGAWDTGYRLWHNDVFIFANVGIAGRTGDNYNNYWDGDDLVWYAKRNGQLLKTLLNPPGAIFLFTRSSNNVPFTFYGEVVAKSVAPTSPVQILWTNSYKDLRNEILPEEVKPKLNEGACKAIFVNKYERNPEARRISIYHYGVKCQACGFSFSRYGRIGDTYIHVHHLVPISSIRKEYVIDPVRDLIPVCANCHAMIHMRNPPFSIDEIKRMLGRCD